MKDFLGNNEKTKVIVKLQKRGSGKPAREPLMSEDERKELMLHAYHRQEQLKVSAFACISLIRISAPNDDLSNVANVLLIVTANKICSDHEEYTFVCVLTNSEFKCKS